GRRWPYRRGSPGRSGCRTGSGRYPPRRPRRGWTESWTAWSTSLSFAGRQPDGKRGAFPQGADHAQTAPVLLQDGADDGQAEAQAPRLGREQRLVYPSQVLRRDADAGVADGDLDGAVGLLCDQGESAALGHRLAGVADQVAEDDQQLIAVAQHGGQR